MDLDANKALVRRYLALWDTEDHQSFAREILAENFVDHTHPNQDPGFEAVAQQVNAFRKAFSNVSISIEHMLAEEDSVAFHFILRCTHVGGFAGRAPTGKEVVLHGADAMSIAKGKIAELWSVQDTLHRVLQLGMKIQQQVSRSHP